MKYFLAALGISIFLYTCYQVVAIFSFSGTFDKKYSREKLTQNFKDRRNDFLDVATFFKQNIPSKKDYSVSFWQHGKTISIHLKPSIIDVSKRTVGVSKVGVDAKELSEILGMLGWSTETVIQLRDKLKRINCNYISEAPLGRGLVVAPHQSGWGSYDYFISNKPVADSLTYLYGLPLGTDSFSVRVFLNYSSAL